MKPGDAASLARYVLKRAPQYQLDPNAVIAVSIQEGISGKVGDNGTSFGPWQLHQGGAYPAGAPQSPEAANAWAWSPAGIDYALSRMQSVAGGLKGRQAVRAIVYRFERPANPAAEYKNAVQALPSGDGGPAGGGGGILGILGKGATSSLAGLPGGPVLQTATGAAGGVSGVVHGAESVATFLGNLTNPQFLLRGLEILGGGLFVLFGLYLLGRQSGVVDRATGAAGTVAAVIPETRAVAPALKAKAAQGQQRRAEAKAARRRRRELDERYGAEAPF